LRNLLRAAAGALPFIPRGDHLPDRTLTVDDLAIDRANVADYAAVTGLRFGDTVPLTYPFALTLPTVMSLVTGFDFPFAAMGSVHLENHITQYRPISVTDTVGCPCTRKTCASTVKVCSSTWSPTSVWATTPPGIR
jgi:hypothetical protein